MCWTFVTLFFWNFSIFCAVWQTSKACKSDKKGFLLWKIHKYLAQKPVNKNCVFDADWKSDKKGSCKTLAFFLLERFKIFGKNIPIFRCDRVQRDLTRWLMRKIFWKENGPPPGTRHNLVIFSEREEHGSHLWQKMIYWMIYFSCQCRSFFAKNDLLTILPSTSTLPQAFAQKLAKLDGKRLLVFP